VKLWSDPYGVRENVLFGSWQLPNNNNKIDVVKGAVSFPADGLLSDQVGAHRGNYNQHFVDTYFSENYELFCIIIRKNSTKHGAPSYAVPYLQ
jgi:hypothetical protein